MSDVRPANKTGHWNCASKNEQGNSQFEKSVNAYILGIAIESRKAPIFHDPLFSLNDAEQEALRLAEKKLAAAKKLTQEQARRERFEHEAIKQANLEKQRQIREQQILAQHQRLEAQLLAERKQKDEQRMAFLSQEKRRLQQQQSNIVQSIQTLQTEKNAELIAKKAQEQQARQAFLQQAEARRQAYLQEVAQEQRAKQQAYEAAIQEEKNRQQERHASWLKQQLLIQQQVRQSQRQAQRKKLKQAKFAVLKKLFTANARATKNKFQADSEFSLADLFSSANFSLQLNASKVLASFAILALLISLSIGSISYASKGYGIKGKVLGASSDGYANLTTAVKDISQQNFEGSSQQFTQAYANFSQGSAQLEEMGSILVDATRFVPFASKLASGKNAMEAGKHFSAAGKSLNEVAKLAAQLKNPIDANNHVSLLAVFMSAQTNIADAKKELDEAQTNVDLISLDDLPKDKQDKFLLLKQQLPNLRTALDLFLDNSHIFADLLGGNGPRKYLFLFQNNSEMRATGGFIGTYGLLDIANGQIKKFFIDGIFNPDGQLKEKIVPPFPIQKISAAWSMHDSNWFADFPTSAQKAIQFYEKTGGPTADGVITFTPTVMQKLLEITGPIEMPEYNVTLDSENFIELTQFKVEVDYDKQDNRPKKILADLAPLVLDKLLESKDLETISRAATAFLEGLEEKHILFYSQNKELQQIISKQGWSGEVLPAAKDYLSVINTNINGYKTDAIVSESISHKAQIQNDGSVIDTVTITRKHNGGNSQYDWLNKVNADYMRVYVPEGSKLLAVSGQTREVDKSPLDYDALGFKRDNDVQNLENNETIDSESGTHIFSEAGKTVFANWTYVSPGETMSITYKYLLPFSLFKVSVDSQQPVDSYSLVAQKQSGSLGSELSSEVEYLAGYNLLWNFPENGQKNGTKFNLQTKLDTDRFVGLVFKKQ